MAGRLGHAELDFDETFPMLANEFPEHNIKGPQAIGGAWVSIHFHVDKADEVIRRAVSAGRRSKENKDGFYGEHSGHVRGPFGPKLRIGHSIEEVSFEEKQRHTEMRKGK
jgi:uncharacterized glyoxalase superfamily protein PhnB